jgi:hypothetical protein
MVAEKASGKAAGSTQKTAHNSATSKKADAAKGQMSISAFFVKKPVQSADAGTPQPPEPEMKASPATGNDEHKKNLQPRFEESISDSETACVDVVPTSTSANSHSAAESHLNDKEDDCIVVSETEPASKSTAKEKVVTSNAVKSTSLVSKLSKNREPKVTKQSSATKQQNTLHFNSNQDSAKSAPKPAKIRPPHPEGLDLNCKSDVIMIAEFISKFRFTSKNSLLVFLDL